MLKKKIPASIITRTAGLVCLNFNNHYMREKAMNCLHCLSPCQLQKKKSEFIFKYVHIFSHNYTLKAQRNIGPHSSDNTRRWVTMLHVCVTSFNHLWEAEDPFCCMSDCLHHDQNSLGCVLREKFIQTTITYNVSQSPFHTLADARLNLRPPQLHNSASWVFGLCCGHAWLLLTNMFQDNHVCHPKKCWFDCKYPQKNWEQQGTWERNPSRIAEDKEPAESARNVIIWHRGWVQRQCNRPPNSTGFQARCGKQGIMEAQAFLQQTHNKKSLIWTSDLMQGTGNKAQLCSWRTVASQTRVWDSTSVLWHFEERGEHAPSPHPWLLRKQHTSRQLKGRNNWPGGLPPLLGLWGAPQKVTHQRSTAPCR